MKRLTIVLEDADADLLLQMAGSPRKQSELITSLIRAASHNAPSANSQVPVGVFPDLEALALKFLRLEGELATLKARLLALETEHTQGTDKQA